MATLTVQHTLLEAIITCRVNKVNLFEGQMQAKHMTEECFNNDFQACIDKTPTTLNDDFKSYSVLTISQGQIWLTPGTKRTIKAFLQWTKDMYCLNEDPTIVSLPINDVANIIRRQKTHKIFIDKSKTIPNMATPAQFTSKIKLIDWYPTFINFLHAIPGRNGVPLSYICYPHTVVQHHTHIDFPDEYVDTASLAGSSFVINEAEIHTYLVKFITENPIAEAKLKTDVDQNNGHLDFLSLKDLFEGIGVNAIDVVKADNILKSIFYSGEKKTPMW